MLGGLHIEMAIEEVIGDFLEGSGWFGIFLNAESRNQAVQRNF